VTLSDFSYPLPRGAVRNECGLAALINVNMLDCDFLLALVPMLCQRFDLSGVAAREFRSVG
jgi:hypothetical protein